MQEQRNVLKGIHHVSAITASGPDNYKFYTEVLGLRLVKKTVNQDDTSMYHLFYGDETGSPGTELTFFEIPMAGPNREGVSSISAISLRVPSDQSLHYWKERLSSYRAEHDDIVGRAGRHTLAFRDKEGQRFILVSDERNIGVAGGTPWAGSPVPAENAIIGLGPVHLTVANPEPTDLILTSVLGFRRKGRYPAFVEGQTDILVYETGEGGTGAEIHLETRTDLPRERQGSGGVHHVAFRVADEKELREWTEHLNKTRIGNSGFVERFYFQSLYFREPNGILFELATDGPGFATDEEMEHLGESLSLPPFLEPHRERIEAGLKPIDTARD